MFTTRMSEMNRRFMPDAGEQDAWALWDAYAYRDDKEIVLAAVYLYGGALAWAVNSLRIDRAFVLEAVMLN
eukprot:1020470-Amphidinium_carterae.1